jgi:hypothetical protein
MICNQHKVIARSRTHLVELQADKTRSKSSSGSDSWDDFASDELGLVLVSLGDSIVGSTAIGSGRDEVDVVIGVIVLLKVDRGQAEASQG